MLAFELRDKVLQYVEAQITVEEFEGWLVPRLLIYLESPDSSNADVVAAIELGLAELSSGIRTEAEIRHILHETIRQQTSVSTTFTNMRTESGASSHTAHMAHSPKSRDLEFNWA